MQLSKSLSLAALVFAVGGAWAGQITPAFTTFGTLAGATFGGSGIPNDAVAITTIGSGLDAITLGLTASQRHSNPALSNDGAGTFRALPGVDTNAPSPADPYALWNFGFYVGGINLNYAYWLLYDFDPANDTDQGAHGSGAIIPGFIPFLSNQDSWNLGMNFLAAPSAPFVMPPSFTSFDPSASGEYTFALVAYNIADHSEAGRSAIRVLVSDVPEPGSLALVGIALLGLAAIRRRKV